MKNYAIVDKSRIPVEAGGSRIPWEELLLQIQKDKEKAIKLTFPTKALAESKRSGAYMGAPKDMRVSTSIQHENGGYTLYVWGS